MVKKQIIALDKNPNVGQTLLEKVGPTEMWISDWLKPAAPMCELTGESTSSWQQLIFRLYGLLLKHWLTFWHLDLLEHSGKGPLGVPGARLKTKEASGRLHRRPLFHLSLKCVSRHVVFHRVQWFVMCCMSQFLFTGAAHYKTRRTNLLPEGHWSCH